MDELEEFDQPAEDNDDEDEDQDMNPPEFPPVEKEGSDDEAGKPEEQRDPAVKAAVDAADKARGDYHDAERKYKDTEQELEYVWT